MGSTVSCHKTDKKTLEFNDDRSSRAQPTQTPLVRDENKKKPHGSTELIHPKSELLDEIYRKTALKKTESDEFFKNHNHAGNFKQMELAQVAQHAKLTTQKTQTLMTEQNKNMECVEEENRSLDLPTKEDVTLEESLQLRDISEDTAYAQFTQSMAKQNGSDTRLVINDDAMERSNMYSAENHLKNNKPIEKEMQNHSEISANSEILVPNNADSCFTETSRDSSGLSPCESTGRDVNIDSDSNDSEKRIKETYVVIKTSETTTENAEHDAEQNILTNVRESITFMKGMKWITSEGRVSKGAMNVLNALQKTSRNVNAQSKSADILLETNTVGKLCELVIFIHKQVTEGQFNVNQTLFYTIGVTIGILVNYTDASEGIAEKVSGYPGMLDALRQILIGFSERKLHEVIAVSNYESRN